MCTKEKEKEQMSKKSMKLCIFYSSENKKTPLESTYWRPEHLRTIEILTRDEKSHFQAEDRLSIFEYKFKPGPGILNRGIDDPLSSIDSSHAPIIKAGSG